MKDALIAAQEEFEILGLSEKPIVELASESESGDCTIYNFMAKNAGAD